MAEVSTIPAYILANENLLHWMLTHPMKDKLVADKRRYLEEFAYVDFHQWNQTRPDHVFRHRWECFIHDYLNQDRTNLYGLKFHHLDGENHCSIVLASLECLMDEYMEARHGKLYVKMDKFGWWQNMLSRLSSLPVLAHAWWRMSQRTASMKEKASPRAMYPYDEGVENYIRSCGLNDSHVHINLCARTDECWLHAMTFRDFEWKIQQEQFDAKTDVVELYREIHPDLTPQVMRTHMELAMRLRYILVNYAKGTELIMPKPHSDNHSDKIGPLPARTILASLLDIPPGEWTDADIPAHAGAPQQTHPHISSPEEHTHKELEWMTDILRKLDEKHDPLIDRAFHLYLLLYNEFHTLCVQRDNFYGFKQFQKYSYVEKTIVGQEFYYESVFRRMHGPEANSQMNYLEIRIAPKKDEEGNILRIKAMLRGYLNYVLKMKDKKVNTPKETSLDYILERLDQELADSQFQIRMVRPAIVFHLIKQAWNHSKNKEEWTPRFHAGRVQYIETLHALKQVMETYPRLRQWVRGIDAAAYEMDTPPDVFAPAFRQAKDEVGIPHMTFHTGEDFYHLISGIRAVWDAIDLLGYQNGDRIGHATSIGVSPALWLHSMPEHIAPTRGEWLQDLVFAWDHLRQCHQMQEIIQMLDFDIREHGYAVFQRPHLSPYILKRVFDLRHLDPYMLRRVYREAEYSLMERLNNPSLSVGKIVQESRKFPSISIDKIVEEVRANPRPPSPEPHLRERRLVYEAFSKEAPDVLQLIFNWQFDKDTWKRSEERIEVPTRYLDEKVLLTLQQLVMKQMMERGIVVESMPSSNLRISQYKEMGQHHSLRWLGHDAYPGDYPIEVVLGTDDPGVFATDIKAEFYHLFASLCKRGINRQEALKKLIEVNECGQRYAFRTLTSNHPSDACLTKQTLGCL